MVKDTHLKENTFQIEPADKRESYYLKVKADHFKAFEELGEITYEVQNQKLENRNVILRYREKFPEIIDLQEAKFQLDQLKLQKQILEEDPGLSLEELFERTCEKRQQIEKKIKQMRLDASMGDRKAWMTVFNTSIDDDELEKEKQKGKDLARQIAMLTHDDVVKKNPVYAKLTEHQKRELQDCFKFAMRIKSNEVGYSPNQLGFCRRSSVELKSILNKVKSILDNAGIDVDSQFLPAGETLEEKIVWYKEQIQLFELQINAFKNQLMVLLNIPDIREYRKHLACPESYNQIRTRLGELTQKYKEESKEYVQLICERIETKGA